MPHSVRIKVISADSGRIEQAVWRALEQCPDNESWDVLVLQTTEPSIWQAAAVGPRRAVLGEGWLSMEPPSTRAGVSREHFYTRLLRGPAEQAPDSIREIFEQLLQCGDEAAA
jgi:hypothetical protein